MTDIGNRFLVQGALLASSIKYKSRGTFNGILLRTRNFPDSALVVAAAMSFDCLDKWQVQVTDEYLTNLASRIDYQGFDLTSASTDLRRFVEERFNKAWLGKNVPKPNLKNPVAPKGPSFNGIFNDISEKIPKTLLKPYE